LPLNIGKMDPAYTVRGHLHWVGVMWDWGWEGKLALIPVHVWSWHHD